MPNGYYQGWAGGIAAATLPVRGDRFQSLGDANRYCQLSFGPEWRVAEHHDGNKGDGGWGFYAAGVIPHTSRFWVNINDQPANCWGNGLPAS
jgi:hypothetical protein